MKIVVTLGLAAVLSLLGTVVETEAGGVTVQGHGTFGPSPRWQHQDHRVHSYQPPHVYVPQPRSYVYYAPVSPVYTADPRWYWDGIRWWFWDGYRWVAY